MFQSTPPRGGRPAHSRIIEGLTIVSIHAPTWGATGGLHRLLYRRRVSIHAPTWGATCRLCSTMYASMFQSTPPRGGRQHLAVGGGSPFRFQSTPPRGGRPGQRPSPCSTCRVSIHAPTWGATMQTAADELAEAIVSIHAPTWGATILICTFADVELGFNPRPHVGGDRHRVYFPYVFLVSIHAPTWGATPFAIT